MVALVAELAEYGLVVKNTFFDIADEAAAEKVPQRRSLPTPAELLEYWHAIPTLSVNGAQKLLPAEDEDETSTMCGTSSFGSSLTSSFGSSCTTSLTSSFSWADEMADERTTIVVQNLPTTMTRAAFCDVLAKENFLGRCSFLYLPLEFSTMKVVGHAFIDLHCNRDAVLLKEALDGLILPGAEGGLRTSWNVREHGLQAHVDRYRNSSMMHASMPDECRPVVFQEGMRVGFPAPTERIKLPKKVTKTFGDDPSRRRQRRTPRAVDARAAQGAILSLSALVR